LFMIDAEVLADRKDAALDFVERFLRVVVQNLVMRIGVIPSFTVEPSAVRRQAEQRPPGGHGNRFGQRERTLADAAIGDGGGDCAAEIVPSVNPLARFKVRRIEAVPFGEAVIPKIRLDGIVAFIE
jgi:hypothetical protein